MRILALLALLLLPTVIASILFEALSVACVIGTFGAFYIVLGLGIRAGVIALLSL
jgi:hypothetical protein